MSETSATFSNAANRDRESRQGATHRRLLVSEYIGEMAADAAQAIRRAGLRPGLERSVGGEAELLGQVVAQEPPAGSELARNAMVTLYVAAPAATPVHHDRAEHPTPSLEPAAAPELAGESHVPDRSAGVRRRRKSRPAQRPPQDLETSPAFLRSDPPSAEPAPGTLTDRDLTSEFVAHEDPSPTDDDQLHELALDDGYGEAQDDELVGHANDVFAGRAAVSWRTVYPTPRSITSSRNQHQRRWRR